MNRMPTGTLLKTQSFWRRDNYILTLPRNVILLISTTALKNKINVRLKKVRIKTVSSFTLLCFLCSKMNCCGRLLSNGKGRQNNNISFVKAEGCAFGEWSISSINASKFGMPQGLTVINYIIFDRVWDGLTGIVTFWDLNPNVFVWYTHNVEFLAFLVMKSPQVPKTLASKFYNTSNII